MARPTWRPLRSLLLDRSLENAGSTDGGAWHGCCSTPRRHPGNRWSGPRDTLLGAVFDVHAGPAGSPVGTGQAQGSTGRTRLETAAGATDPTMEQGPGAPAPGRGRGRPWRGGWETTCSRSGGEGREGKVVGEGAPVMAGPDAHPRGHGHVPDRVAVGGGKASKGRTAPWGAPFRDGVKHGEPQDREQGATNLHGRGGGSRRGGEKPRGRNARGAAALLRRPARRRAGRDADSSARNDGGAIFGQPQERKSGRQVGPHGSRRDGRAGVKVRRVEPPMPTHVRAPGRRDLEDPGERRRSRRGAAKQSAAEATGRSLPVEALARWWRVPRRTTPRGSRRAPTG